MRIALFTPCTDTSSIGRDSLHIERELLKLGHQVTIVRIEDTECIDTSTHPYHSTILRWDESERIVSLRATVDMAVYQIGNHFPFHRGALEWLPQWPGVICLHDYFVGNMFRAWADRRREDAIAALTYWYGEEIASAFFLMTSSGELVEKLHAVAPLTEWISAQALGVLTHSSWGIQRVLNACPGPVYVAGVPTGTLHLENASAESTSQPGQQPPEAAPKARFTVLTVGHANPNKRSESVIQAIGSSIRLKSTASYHLVGPIEPARAKHLTDLATHLGVELVIRGQVDNATLAQEITSADILCCLRYPTLEAASGSAIEAMLSGKAVVVMDVGFYSEIPNKCVRKVQVEREIESLCAALEFLYDHPDERRAMGAHARAWAEQAFNPENYVEKLLEVCRLASVAQAQIEAGHFFAEALSRWGATRELILASGASPWLDVSLPLLPPLSDHDEVAVNADARGQAYVTVQEGVAGVGRLGP